MYSMKDKFIKVIINFVNNKASIIEDFEKKLQAQTESHEQKLNELG